MALRGVTKPFRRTARQFRDGRYGEGGRGRYIDHPGFADRPEHYIRAYEVLEKDLRALFEFIEPADQNLQTYSLRCYELLLRICTEVETNFKAILRENTYSKSRNLTVADFYKVNTSHYLSDYDVWVPYWSGTDVRRPFLAWSSGRAQLSWYVAYNEAKHDRVANLHLATFGQVTDAMCGLVVLLAAQFHTHDFAPGPDILVWEGLEDGRESAIGQFFRVGFPSPFPRTSAMTSTGRFSRRTRCRSIASTTTCCDPPGTPDRFDYDVL